MATKVNEITVGGVSVSVWTAVDPVAAHHNEFKIEVGDEWVCVGGGAKGHWDHGYISERDQSLGNYLTASFPSSDLKSWTVSSKDHINPDPIELIGFAVGMKITGLTRDELIAHMKIFDSDDDILKNHPAHSCFIEDGFLLLGGGFNVLDQSDGNLATASYPDSTLSWRACSKDHKFPSPSRLRVFAIGIMPTLTKAGSLFGTVLTSFNSVEVFPVDSFDYPPTPDVHPLPGFAMCGGGGVCHYQDGTYLISLMPTRKPDPITDQDQVFTVDAGLATTFFENVRKTAYAMGVKFIPNTPMPPPPPACDKKMTITEVSASSSVNEAVYSAKNAKDDNPATKWMSNNEPNPFISFALRERKHICRVDIAWADGNNHKYKFKISAGYSSSLFGDVASKESTGTTTDPEQYTFTPSDAQFLKITITESTPGTPNSIAQISEVLIYSND